MGRSLIRNIGRYLQVSTLCITLQCGGRVEEPIQESPAAVASGDMTPVWVDYRFTDVEREAIKHAFEEWNAALTGIVDLHIVSYDFDNWPEVIRNIYDTQQGIVVYSQPTCRGFYGGWVDTINGNFIRSCKFPPDVLKSIVMHEVGHILGLTHNNTPGSLMYPEVGPGACLDAETVEQLNRLRGWAVKSQC